MKLEAVKLYGLIPIMAGSSYGQLVHVDFMRTHRDGIAQQEFKMTVIRTPPPAARSSPAPSTPGPSTSTAADEDEWETPNSLDALEPRLTEEACCDWGIDIGRRSESDWPLLPL